MNSDFHRELDALLDNFWISRQANPELYQRVKDKLPKFRDFIDNKLGARLQSNNYLIRLEKVPPEPQSYMGIKDFDNKLDYVLLMYVLSFLEGKAVGDRFSLQQIIEHIDMLFASQDTNNLMIDWTLFKHRKSLVKVLNLMTNLGMATAFLGDASDFSRQRDSDAMYENTGLSRFAIRQFDTNIHNCDTYQDIIDNEKGSFDASSGRLRRNQVYRKLTFNPVVVSNEDTDYDFDYIRQYHSSVLANDINKYLDANLHVHRNMAMILANTEKRYKDVFPSDKAISDIVCLLCSHLRNKVADGELVINSDDTLVITSLQLKKLITDVKLAYHQFFSKEFREMSDELFYREILSHMQSFAMIKVDEDITFYPVVFKFSAHYNVKELVR